MKICTNFSFATQETTYKVRKYAKNKPNKNRKQNKAPTKLQPMQIEASSLAPNI